MESFLTNPSMDLSTNNQMLTNTLIEEQLNFIKDQIRNPFDSSKANHFKRLCKLVSNPDTLDQYCTQLMDELENTYAGLEFDVSDYDKHLEEFFMVVYKFFVKSISTIMFTFLKEYILQAHNRKRLTLDYLNAKIPSYPKEQYGKKEYYILMIKLNNIIHDIYDDQIGLSDFIRYVKRDEDCPGYVEKLESYLSEGLIGDQNVVGNLFELFFDSDIYEETYCKLQVVITETLIYPYLVDNGMEAMRLPPVEADESLEDEDEEDVDKKEDVTE